MNMLKCPLCRGDANIKPGEFKYTCSCQRCKKFSLCPEFEREVSPKFEGKLHLLSGYSRSKNERGDKPEFREEEQIRQILTTTQVPQNINEKIDHLLLAFEIKTLKEGEIGTHFPLDLKLDYPLGFFKTAGELGFVLEGLHNEKIINYVRGANTQATLTFRGLQKIEEIRSKKRPISSINAFVAMKFGKGELDYIYENVIKEAIEDTGYEPIRVDKVEHIDKICDRVDADIKESRFIIADFTTNPGNVYYEAGFAKGLKIPVIWTVRKDSIDELQFDLRQYNCIVWEEEKKDDFKERLTDRIRAIIGINKG